MNYLLTRIENHRKALGKVEDNKLMSIAYESEIIEIANGECLSHAQLTRHIELLHEIIESYTLPTFADMMGWHEYLLQDKAFAGRIRTFPAGRYTRQGAWVKYPLVPEGALKRIFDVFLRVDSPSLIAIANFHITITEAHPFSDGNGRVCRLVLNAHLHQNGYGLCLIGRDNKDEYLTLLEDRDISGLALFIDNNLVM